MSGARSTTVSTVLRGLPATFTYTQGRDSGLSDRQLYRLRKAGLIEHLSRGLYRRSGAAPADIDLLEIALRAPRATLCLASALARHGLIDEIPAAIDIALPRGQHRPTTAAPATWHMFALKTFDIGREMLPIDDQTGIGIYSPTRCIIDMFRLRHLEGPDLANTALRRWLTVPGSSPAQLLDTATRFPQAQRALQQALEILL